MTAQDDSGGTQSAGGDAAFTSPLDAALRYASRGWPVFPCRPAPDKQPMTEHGFLDASVEEAQIVRWWRRWPGAQIGVATEAAGLCVVDLDMDATAGKDGIATFSRMVDEHGLHGCGLIASTPRGGRHYVYLMPGDSVQSGVDIVPGSGIDVRAAGGYIIVPSPASPGREWVIGDPFSVGEDGASDLCAMSAWVRALVGTNREHRGGSSAGSRESGRVIPLDDVTVDRIRRALDHVENDTRDSWIRIAMALKSTGARDQAYDLWVEWAKRWTSPELVHPKFDMKEKSPKVWRSIHEYRHDGSEITLGTLFHMAKAAGWEPSLDEEIAMDTSPQASAPPAEPAQKPIPVRPFPLELMNVPGLVGDIAKWMVESSPRRQPACCLASTLVTLGALLGRRVSTPTDLRTNLYALGIAETGSGKDPSVKLPQVLFAHAGLNRFIGPGEWKSDSGLRAALIAEPSHVCLIDEFTKVLDGMSGRQVPPHVKGIKRYVLTLFTTANGVHLAPAYADRKLNAPVAIGEPNLGIYGTGVPDELFSSLDRGAMSDGFFNRFLVFFADDQAPKRQRVGRAVPPPDLITALKDLDRRTKPKGNLQGGSDVSVATGCVVVPQDDEAAAYLEQLQADNEVRIAQMREKGDPLVDLWIRLGEHVAKLALVRSVGDDPSRSTNLHDIRWAHQLVVWCIERTMVVAEARVADSPQEALTKRVLRIVTAAGPKGLTQSRLTRATQWLRRGDRKDILQTLVEAGQVATKTQPIGSRAPTLYFATAELSSAEITALGTGGQLAADNVNNFTTTSTPVLKLSEATSPQSA